MVLCGPLPVAGILADRKFAASKRDIKMQLIVRKIASHNH